MKILLLPIILTIIFLITSILLIPITKIPAYIVAGLLLYLGIKFLL